MLNRVRPNGTAEEADNALQKPIVTTAHSHLKVKPLKKYLNFETTIQTTGN